MQSQHQLSQNKAIYSHARNHLEGVHSLQNRVANIGDKILELDAYQKAVMVARLSFMTAGIHMGSVLDIANSLKVKLEALIGDIERLSSGVKTEAEMSMIELLKANALNVGLLKFLVSLFIN
jgi:hypothetical protein